MTFKLTPTRISKAKSKRKEKYAVSGVLDYLSLLVRCRIPIHFWVNEENPGINGKSHPKRGRASDVLGIHKGRLLCFELKTEAEYHRIINNWDKWKSGLGGQGSTVQHYLDQIRFVETINQHGGLAIFAWDWRQVRDRLIQEGIDTTGMIYAGEPK